MAGSLGHWPLRGYGVWACEKVDGGNFVGGIGHLAAARSAGTGARLLTRSAILGTKLRDRGSDGGARLAVRALPLARATSFIRPDNHASIRVARRLGAVCKTRRRWFRKSYGRYSPPIHLDH